jgi:catechol 2,3-dioxygenase-like lactoylglutathione lyase family enzyme
MADYGRSVGTPKGFRLGRLDHVHLRVPDREAAAAWYSDNLGFEAVEEYRFWAVGIDGGPLQMSADGGATSLALFQAGDGQPIVAQHVAFSVDAPSFVAFARSLPGDICDADGSPLTPDAVVDFDLCWAFDFVDPWGHQFELNCYDHEAVRITLIEADGIVPARKWPADLHRQYLDRA